MTWPLAYFAAALRAVGLAIEAPHAAWCLLGDASPVLACRPDGTRMVRVVLPMGAPDALALWGRRHPKVLARRDHLTPLTPAAVTVLLAESTP